MKPCPKCGVTKSLDEFHLDRTSKDGHQSTCKSCKREYKERYLKSEHGQQITYRYSKTKRYKEAQQRYRQSAKGRKKRREIDRRYRQSEHGRKARRAYWASEKGRKTRRRERRRWPQKFQSRDAVAKAIKTGKKPPIRILNCADCGRPAEHYHHPDYSQPLEVIPLCQKCHHAHHLDLL